MHISIVKIVNISEIVTGKHYYSQQLGSCIWLYIFIFDPDPANYAKVVANITIASKYDAAYGLSNAACLDLTLTN